MPHADQIPQRIGKYVVTRRLGRGGMGEVFEATDPDLGRKVALKLIAISVDDGSARERFRQEARSAASLMHPNVVAVHGVDTSSDGRPFLVMELVSGGSAADLVRSRGRLPWREATRILIDACRGIAAAHAAGLIHRDIKPANLLLSADGSTKVGDFGLARSMSPEERRLTGSRLILGTAYYMSPEQCRGDEPVNDLSDVYALGATYYALLTGHPPYNRADEMQVCYAHCTAPVPDPRLVVAEVPVAVSEIVRLAMAKQPFARFQSATSLLTALEKLLNEDTSPERPAGTARVDAETAMILGPRKQAGWAELPTRVASSGSLRRSLFLILLGVVLTGGSVVIWLATRPTPRSEPSPASPSDTVELFNGIDLAGWNARMPGSGKWTVEDGLLVGRGPSSYLFTDRSDYLNFRLLIEARVPSVGTNTGIYVRCHPSDSLPKGYEMQVGWSGGNEETGRLFANLPHGPLSGHNDPLSIQAGDWLKLEIELRERRLIFIVNGTTTLDWENTEDPLKPGHIAIQAFSQGPAIEVRRLAIREFK